tara:strand:- start:2358 stop:2792 length:435 start_codon:yes stop_codon:yes gene_type:complete
MSDSTDSLFINLKVLAQIKPSHQLNSQNDLLYIESNEISPLTWIRRLFFGDSRERTLSRISEIIIQCDQYCTLYCQYEIKIKRMHAHLESTCQGLENLKKTYENDITTTACLDNLVDKIQHIISKQNIDSKEINNSDDSDTEFH